MGLADSNLYVVVGIARTVNKSMRWWPVCWRGDREEARKIVRQCMYDAEEYIRWRKICELENKDDLEERDERRRAKMVDGAFRYDGPMVAISYDMWVVPDDAREPGERASLSDREWSP